MKELPSGELVDMLVELARERGMHTARAFAARSEKDRSRAWAMAKKAEEAEGRARVEVMTRMGISISSEAANRPGFIFLAGAKSGRLCDKCRTSGGWRGRTLNWWTEEGMPLPLVQAHNGADRDQLKHSLLACRLLCPRCATKWTNGKATMLSTGRPDLSAWK